MVIDKHILDELTAKAKESPKAYGTRLRALSLAASSSSAKKGRSCRMRKKEYSNVNASDNHNDKN